jgi:hypothetical protein
MKSAGFMSAGNALTDRLWFLITGVPQASHEHGGVENSRVELYLDSLMGGARTRSTPFTALTSRATRFSQP